MSLIIATGSNTGNKLENLCKGKSSLSDHFQLISESRIYKSEAVDYTNQPFFLNQVLEFRRPYMEPKSIMEHLIQLEIDIGRKKTFDKGPRIIDLDILFLGTKKINIPTLTVPHPKVFERSFVLLPLRELPFYTELTKKFTFPKSIPFTAIPI